jgi:hypothetical protein
MTKINPAYVVHKVVAGKRVLASPPKAISNTNADMIRRSKHGLYALQHRKNKYVNKCIQYNNQFPRSLSKKQIALLNDLFQSVDVFLHKNPLIDPSKHRITKALRNQVSNLDVTYGSYQKNLRKSHLPVLLEGACKDLIEFVIEFAASFHFIDSLISDIRKIPNRTPDCALRVLVDKIIVDFQREKNTKKYPKYPYVLRMLESARGHSSHEKLLPKLQLSERQYGNFKNWRDRGTFWWYIQPQ